MSRLFVTAALAVYLSAGPLLGQEAVSARLSGTILDQNEAVVPGAKVTLSNAQTGFTRSVTTSEAGVYTFTLIPPGTHEMKAEKEGFSAAVQSGINLTVGQATTLDVRLQVGAVTQSVQVEERHQGVPRFGLRVARDSIFDAKNFFNNKNGLDRTDFKRNQFGFTAGGPLYLPHVYPQRDKPFIFGSCEGLRQETPTTLITTVPTDVQRQRRFFADAQPGQHSGCALQSIYDA